MAKNKIRGVTVEIGGDTSGLQKSLKDVEKTINSTTKQLKDVNNLLKLDPSNTDLLKQRQALLATQIEDTKKKLEEEKQMLAQLNAENGTDAPSEGQMALQRDIIETENQLKALEKQSASCSSVIGSQFQVAGEAVKEFGGKVKDVGGSVENLGKAMAPVSAAAAALGGGIAASWKEVDDAMDTVIKMTGASGDALEGFQQSVENIATSIPTSFDAAAQAVGEVNTRFGATGDQLEELSTQFIQFSEINGTDLVASIDSVQKALSAYGLGADQAGAMMDRLTVVSQSTGVNIDKLTSGLISNGTAFQEMGLSMDQAVTFMGNLEKSGANSETVLNGMRKALKNATDDGIPLNEALKQLQDTIANGTDDMDGLTAAYEMFGKSGDQIFGAVKNGTIDFSELGAAVEDAGGKVAETYEATLDPTDQLTTSMNDLKTVGEDLAESVMPIVAEALGKVSEVIKDVSTWFKSLDEDQKRTIVTVIGLVAAIAPALIIIGKIIGFIGTVITAIGSFISGMGTVITVITTIVGILGGPVTLVILGVIAVITAIIAIMKDWGGIGTWLSEKWTEFKDFMSELWDSIKAKVSETWENIKTSVSETFNNIVTTVKEKATEMIQGFISNVKEKIATVKETISSIKQAITDKFHEIVDNAKNWGKDMITGFINGIKEMIGKLKDTVTDVASAIWEKLHFSVPENGPLADADKWMPDMMDLLASTMENSINLLDPAINETAQRIAQLSGIQITPNNADVIDYLRGALPGLGEQVIVLDTGALVGQTVNQYNDALGKLYTNDARRV